VAVGVADAREIAARRELDPALALLLGQAEDLLRKRGAHVAHLLVVEASADLAGVAHGPRQAAVAAA
jgi:hypothetical protein